MTLFDARPPKPPSTFRRYAPVVIVGVLTAGALMGYWFRNYSEERAVARFLSALKTDNYQDAYRQWRPASSYSYQDFLRDWGAHGDYGRIREFQILHSRSKGSNTVIVTVRVNNVDPPVELLVDRTTKGLAYSVF